MPSFKRYLKSLHRERVGHWCVKTKTHLKFLDTFVPDLELMRQFREAPGLRLHTEAVSFSFLVIPGKSQNITKKSTTTSSVYTVSNFYSLVIPSFDVMKSDLREASVTRIWLSQQYFYSKTTNKLLEYKFTLSATLRNVCGPIKGLKMFPAD